MRGKKFRGRRRYYRKLARCVSEFQVNTNSNWHDLWHAHFDHRLGIKISASDRAPHLTALFQAFDRVLVQVAGLDRPYQTWLYIDMGDPSYDALYYHTPNPNQDNFPFLFPGVTWSIPTPAFLARFMKPELELGSAIYEGNLSYHVRSRMLSERLVEPREGFTVN